VNRKRRYNAKRKKERKAELREKREKRGKEMGLSREL
jgi:hypothetical protein